MEHSQIVIGILFVPVLLQILLPLVLLLGFFLRRLTAPIFPGPWRSSAAAWAPCATSSPQA